PPLRPRGDARGRGGPSRCRRQPHPRDRRSRGRRHQSRTDVSLPHQGGAARRRARTPHAAVRERTARGRPAPGRGRRRGSARRPRRPAPPRLPRLGLRRRALRGGPRHLRRPQAARPPHRALAGAAGAVARGARRDRSGQPPPTARRAPPGRRRLVRPGLGAAGDLRAGGGLPASTGPRSARRDGMIPWMLLLGAILSEVTATLSLRGALDHRALYVVVVTGYAISFVLLAQVLKRGMGLGVAYGLWGAGGVVLTALRSAVFFGEAFTALKIVGIVLVAAGVAVVELGSRTARAEEAG